VALIALAVGLPVTLFLQSAFEVANDAEQPESWLVWRGAARLLLGLRAHRRWHYTGPRGQPRRFVRWYCRSKDAPFPEKAADALHALRCALTGSTPRWTLQARAAAAQAAAKAEADECGACAREPDSEDGLDSHDVDAAEAAALSLYKRACAAAGLAGTALTWAAFAWFIFTCARPARCVARAPSSSALTPQRRRAQTACSSTSCWATRRSSPSRAPGASPTAWAPRRNGVTWQRRWRRPSRSWCSSSGSASRATPGAQRVRAQPARDVALLLTRAFRCYCVPCLQLARGAKRLR
jgi:hypothetical protein